MLNVKVGLCQMSVSDNKKANIEKATTMIEKAAKNGAEIVVLPEMFNTPYDNSYFRPFSESFPGGETINALSKCAREFSIFLVGGSIPEIDENANVYNTSFVFDDKGNLIGKHRKMHLFDIDIKDGITFKESETLTRGNNITIMDTKWGKVGIAICYDIRFPELMRIMALQGAKMVFVPAAFNMTTGPAHWDISFRTRALDNQIFLAAVSPARNTESCYVAYGNSMIVDPWGSIVGKLDERENILVKEINLNYVDKVRESLPLLEHRRTDIYKLELL